MRPWIAAVVGIVMFFVGVPSSWAEDESHPETELEQGAELVLEFLVSEGFMPSRLELRHLSEDVVGDLVEIAAGRYPWRVRQRAVRCLAMYRDDARALSTFEYLIGSISPTSKLFPQVLVGYMEVLGEEGVDAVGPLLGHSSRFVRLGAVVGLGRFGGQRGYELLEKRWGKERDVLVKQQIQQYVTPSTEAVAAQ